MAAKSGMAEYEPRIIEQFAEKLYGKASAFVMGSVVIGGSLGAAFGAVPLTSLGAAWPIPSYLGFATLLFGGLIGAVCGYVIGDARSFGYRLQAQMALCQLETERNTAETRELLKSFRVAAPRQSVPAPAPASAPAPAAPAPQPAPVAPPPPAPPAAANGSAAPAQPPLTPPVTSRVA